MRFSFLVLLGILPLLSVAQKNKVDKIKFCGVSYSDSKKMREQLQEQFDFLKVREHDTIVDIGAASGWYEGAFSAFSTLKNIHFILVDIDSSCLNRAKVNNMIAHYSALKGNAITNSFQLVHNSPDSLWLPPNTYRKAWLMNVLHEIPDQQKMAKDILNILQPGGELIVLEFVPKKPGQLHGGCRKPLLTLEEWKHLMEQSGFRLAENISIMKDRGRSHISMMRFVKI